MEIISSNALEKRLAANEELTLVDVRTEEEVAQGMIPNAIHINFFSPDFMNKIDELEKDKTYVMVCRSGARSGQACLQMMGLGFDKVYNLEGGMLGWTGETTV